jgi:hypothetical protein
MKNLGSDEEIPRAAESPAAWPALMPLAMAARYLSLDENSFRLVTAEASIGTVDLA